MTKIQIIIDDDKSLQGLTCSGIEISPTPSYESICHFDYERAKEFSFITKDVVLDESPQLISLPDELLLRIRDYNIDVEHQNKLDETNKLSEKIESLKNQVYGWEARRNVIQEEVEVYHQVLLEIMEDHPGLASEVAARLGFLDIAVDLARRAKEEE